MLTLEIEMKSLRESAEKRIEERVGYIEAVRTDALTAIATEVGVSWCDLNLFPLTL